MCSSGADCSHAFSRPYRLTRAQYGFRVLFFIFVNTPLFPQAIYSFLIFEELQASALRRRRLRKEHTCNETKRNVRRFLSSPRFHLTIGQTWKKDYTTQRNGVDHRRASGCMRLRMCRTHEQLQFTSDIERSKNMINASTLLDAIFRTKPEADTRTPTYPLTPYAHKDRALVQTFALI